jgi:hypothetical protein
MIDRSLSRAASLAAALALGVAASRPAAAGDPGPGEEVPVDLHGFEVAASESGRVSYYTMVEGPEGVYIRGRYRPPLETATLALRLPDWAHRRVARLRWQWRANTLPVGGDECRQGYGDSAASMYVTWKRGLKWYSIKYVWSTVGQVGLTCDRVRNPFVVQDTVVLRSGPPLGVWMGQEVDPSAEFRAHFGDEPPDLVGLGLMSDGDQTRSPAAADFRNFSIVAR